MEIMSNHNRQELLDYIPYIKASVKEWLFVDVRLAEEPGTDFTVMMAAKMLHAMFCDKEGKIYICNEHEILMLIRWKKPTESDKLTRTVTKELGEERCKVSTQGATAEGFMKIALLIGRQKPSESTLADKRSARKENVVLVADDDMYMRMLVKKGVPPGTAVHELSTGTEVVDAYKEYLPDMVFLDIHLPGREGTQLLHDLLAYDSSAYIIMLSADSSPENVEFTAKKGAKDFLTKPFNKERLLECFHKCPTLC